MTSHTTHKPINDDRTLLTSTVLAVVLRVAGPVEIGLVTHALGFPERQVSVRIGDALAHLTDPEIAGLIRERWDAAFGAALRLPNKVSQPWLAPRPGTYPAAISLQLTDQAMVSGRFVPAHTGRHQPGHLEMKVDRLVWQVCDFTAWKTISLAWHAAHQALLQ